MMFSFGNFAPGAAGQLCGVNLTNISENDKNNETVLPAGTLSAAELLVLLVTAQYCEIVSKLQKLLCSSDRYRYS